MRETAAAVRENGLLPNGALEEVFRNWLTRSSAGASARVVRVPIANVKPGDSPRQQREDAEHIQVLAQTPSQLPPIVLRAEDLAVVDGTHRLAAESLRGASHIDAVIFEGDDLAAFVEAVRRNVRHGKPLTLVERRAAALRILTADPARSDRSIAEICGVSPKSVAALRARATGDGTQLNMRLGKDGRARPVDGTYGRLRAANILRHAPNTSLREVARRTGISLATVRDVRRRLLEGIDPVPSRPASATAPPPADTCVDARWTNDQALLRSDDGAEFVRWFEATEVHDDQWRSFVDAVPVSRVYEVADEALRRSREWAAFAEQLTERLRAVHRRA